MLFRLIDSHSHLHLPPFDEDRDAILARMEEKGMATITVGTNGLTSNQAIDLAEKYPRVFASVGFHPGNLDTAHEDPAEPRDETPYSIDRMREIAQSSKRVVAIGEIGLDYSRLPKDGDVEAYKDRQRIVFLEQFHLAQELELPAIIHCRDAFDDLLVLLADEQNAGKNLRAVIHCYTGDWALAQKLLDLGLFISFTGIITFPTKKSQDPETDTKRVVERMPLESMMIETDAPWLAPVPHRGKQNEPPYVEYVAETIANLRGISKEEVMSMTAKTAERFFGI